MLVNNDTEEKYLVNLTIVLALFVLFLAYIVWDSTIRGGDFPPPIKETIIDYKEWNGFDRPQIIINDTIYANQ